MITLFFSFFSNFNVSLEIPLIQINTLINLLKLNSVFANLLINLHPIKTQRSETKLVLSSIFALYNALVYFPNSH